MALRAYDTDTACQGALDEPRAVRIRAAMGGVHDQAATGAEAWIVALRGGSAVAVDARSDRESLPRRKSSVRSNARHSPSAGSTRTPPTRMRIAVASATGIRVSVVRA